MYNYNMYNQNLINQLMRQKDNIDSMLNNMSQPAPVQNIINTSNNSIEFEARELNDGEDVHNVFVSRKTLFIDEKNKKFYIKEIDGKISKTYDIIVPKDEKDLKIEEQENELNILKEKMQKLEEMLNDKHTKYIVADDEFKQSNGNDDTNVEPTAKSLFKSISKQKQ